MRRYPKLESEIDNHSIWNVLNSPFIVALLTTVAIGITTLLYSAAESRAKRMEERRAELSRLLTELEVREGRVSAIIERVRFSPADSPERLSAGADFIKVALGTEESALSGPEFRNVRLETLMYRASDAAGLKRDVVSFARLRALTRTPENAAAGLALYDPLYPYVWYHSMLTNIEILPIRRDDWFTRQEVEQRYLDAFFNERDQIYVLNHLPRTRYWLFMRPYVAKLPEDKAQPASRY